MKDRRDRFTDDQGVIWIGPWVRHDRITHSVVVRAQREDDRSFPTEVRPNDPRARTRVDPVNDRIHTTLGDTVDVEAELTRKTP